MKNKVIRLIGVVVLVLSLTILFLAAFHTNTDTLAGSQVNAPNARIPIRWFIGLNGGTLTEEITVEQQVVDLFNASQTAISLTMEVVPGGQAIGQNALRQEITSGNPPDIVGPLGIDASSFFHGQWLDLYDLVFEHAYDLSDYDPAVLKSFQIEGEGLIGLPINMYPSFIFYNKDLFDAVGLAYPPHVYGEAYSDPVYGGPWTVEKLKEIGMLLTLDNNGKNANDPTFDPANIVQFGFLQQWGNDIRTMVTLFGANSFVDVHGDAQIPDNWRAAVHWIYHGMWQDFFIPNDPYASSAWFGNWNTFDSGHLAMAHINSWYTCCLGNVANWDIAATPSYSGTTTSNMDTNALRVLNTTQHPEEAFQVLTYLVENAALAANIYIGFPARISMQADAISNLEATLPNADWQVLLDSIPYADSPNHEGYLPNYPIAIYRINQFAGQFRNDPAMDIDTELDNLKNDLQTIFHAGVNWAQVNADGFGDPANDGIPSLAVFDDYLYAGAHNYISTTYGITETAQIWRTPDGTSWEQVDSRDANGAAALIPFQGYLYSGSWDGMIWRSPDGLAWTEVITDGFGVTDTGIAHFAVFSNTLYASTWGGPNGSQVWQTTNGTDWVVNNPGIGNDPNNVGAISSEIFQGKLYWGVGNWVSGAQLYRTDGITWTPIITDGFGITNNGAVSALCVFSNTLYAGIWNDNAVQVWRSANGIDWEKVVDGLAGGANMINALEVYQDQLYLVVQNDASGLQVWHTANGTDWNQVGFYGFGDVNNNWSFYDNATTVFKDKLYVSTANNSTGGEVWQMSPPSAQLLLEKNVQTPDLIWPGKTITYTIVLSNQSDITATAVALTDVLPEEVIFGGWLQNDGAVVDFGTLTWEGDLPANSSLTLVFTTTLDLDNDVFGMTVNNLAHFSSQNAGLGSDLASFGVPPAYYNYLSIVIRH